MAALKVVTYPVPILLCKAQRVPVVNWRVRCLARDSLDSM